MNINIVELQKWIDEKRAEVNADNPQDDFSDGTDYGLFMVKNYLKEEAEKQDREMSNVRTDNK